MQQLKTSEKYNKLYKSIYDLYHLPQNKDKLLFHGWHHIKFVHDKAIEFAQELTADIEIVASAALTHDLNFVFTEELDPSAAKSRIALYLSNSGFNRSETKTVTSVAIQAHTENRDEQKLSKEAMALSDADTLFKSLPITPILFASKYIAENKFDIKRLAEKIVSEQEPLMKQGKYFYTDSAKNKYLKWATTNLELWENVLEALEDDSVNDMLKNTEGLGIF